MKWEWSACRKNFFQRNWKLELYPRKKSMKYIYSWTHLQHFQWFCSIISDQNQEQEDKHFCLYVFHSFHHGNTELQIVPLYTGYLIDWVIRTHAATHSYVTERDTIHLYTCFQLIDNLTFFPYFIYRCN